MNVAANPERQAFRDELRASARDFCTRELESSRLRGEVMVDPLPPRVWIGVAERGWLDILSPGSREAGLGVPEALLVCLEAGAALLPGPIVETMLAAQLGVAGDGGVTTIAALATLQPQWPGFDCVE